MALLACPSNGLAEGMSLPPVHIDYFFSPGCKDCIRIRDHVLPVLKERYSGYHVLVEHDIGVASNMIKLACYQKRLNITKNESVCMVLDYHDVLNGYTAIHETLFAHLGERIADRADPGWHLPVPIVDDTGVTPVPSIGGSSAAVWERMEGFVFTGVLAAGLVDSLNPCAISTLVFFLSILTLAGSGRKHVALAGGAFVISCYVTYLSLGFGAFRMLHLFTGFGAIRSAVEWGMVALMAGLATLSFRDAWRFSHGGRESDVSVRMPSFLRSWIHRLIHRGLKAHNLILGGLGLGIVVTVLESVCTGQVYVPTLVLILKTGKSVMRSLLYLLAYNAMFVLPLVVLLVLVYQGLGMKRLIEWSRREVVAGKVLMGFFFLAMAVLLAIL